jgi:hypothetical protein
VAADANDGRLLQPIRMESCLFNAPDRSLQESLRRRRLSRLSDPSSSCLAVYRESASLVKKERKPNEFGPNSWFLPGDEVEFEVFRSNNHRLSCGGAGGNSFETVDPLSPFLRDSTWRRASIHRHQAAPQRQRGSQLWVCRPRARHPLSCRSALAGSESAPEPLFPPKAPKQCSVRVVLGW